MRKTFLSNAINTSLQEIIIATPISAIYIGYCDLFHGVNNNLEALRIKKKREIEGNLPANKSTGSFAGNFTGNSVENTTDEMDWSPTTNVAASVTTATTEQKTKWVSQKVIDGRKAKRTCFRCGMAGHKVGNCSLLPLRRPVQAPPLVSQRIPWSTAHPHVNGKWDEEYMGGGARLLSFLKLSFLYIGAI